MAFHTITCTLYSAFRIHNLQVRQHIQIISTAAMSTAAPTSSNMSKEDIHHLRCRHSQQSQLELLLPLCGLQSARWQSLSSEIRTNLNTCASFPLVQHSITTNKSYVHYGNMGRACNKRICPSTRCPTLPDIVEQIICTYGVRLAAAHPALQQPVQVTLFSTLYSVQRQSSKQRVKLKRSTQQCAHLHVQITALLRYPLPT
jgi:hypothetical protein